MNNQKINDHIEIKNPGLSVSPETYIKGLLPTIPINYKGIVEVKTLLTLKEARTNFKEEKIINRYHQDTELFLILMVHEIKQLVYWPFDKPQWMEKLDRLNRYSNMPNRS